jgi:acetyl esterase/lipase
LPELGPSTITAKASSAGGRGTWLSRRECIELPLVGALAIIAACSEGMNEKTPTTPGAREALDLLYRPGSSHDKHRLDVFMPPVPRAPVVHFVHGGYWVSGDRKGGGHGAGLYASIGRALVSRGIGCVIQSYRLAPEVGIDGILDDVMAALSWTERHIAEHGGDPSRIFMMGHSAGGHIAALIAADDSLHEMRGMRREDVRGCIALSAIWDVEDMADTQGTAFGESVTLPVFGEDRARWRARSPMQHLDAETTPMLIAVGERDFPYMIPQAEHAHDKLAAAGHDASHAVIPGNSHMDMVLRFGDERDNMTDRVAAFVKAH